MQNRNRAQDDDQFRFCIGEPRLGLRQNIKKVFIQYWYDDNAQGTQQNKNDQKKHPPLVAHGMLPKYLQCFFGVSLHTKILVYGTSILEDVIVANLLHLLAVFLSNVDLHHFTFDHGLEASEVNIRSIGLLL